MSRFMMWKRLCYGEVLELCLWQRLCCRVWLLFVCCIDSVRIGWLIRSQIINARQRHLLRLSLVRLIHKYMMRREEHRVHSMILMMSEVVFISLRLTFLISLFCFVLMCMSANCDEEKLGRLPGPKCLLSYFLFGLFFAFLNIIIS